MGREPYNLALREQVPGFDRGMLVGSVPLLVVGAGIWLIEALRSRRERAR
jgi:hypothetical protein